MFLIAAVNLRGVSEGVELDVVLTVVELSGLLTVIGLGFRDVAGVFAVEGPEDPVTTAEEAKDPGRSSP
ncbi:hypothetical protein ACFEMC_22790 [Kineococcus sp. DHX-1]|uniref:hypothetical protein n=1 Tax=Kineococcus sp. DHX-1 TaxID=3349638 RepID=UPI0036D41097